MKKIIVISAFTLISYFIVWAILFSIEQHTGGQTKHKEIKGMAKINGRDIQISRRIIEPNLIRRNWFMELTLDHESAFKITRTIFSPLEFTWVKMYTIDMVGYIDESGRLIEYDLRD